MFKESDNGKNTNRVTGSFSEINNRQALRNYLFGYSKMLQHVGNFLITYKRIDTLIRSLQTGKWRIGNPRDMNDKKELADFHRADWSRIYFSCFVADSDESIAMWSLYARPWADGISIKIPRRVFSEWTKNIQAVYEYDKNKNEYIELSEADVCVVRVAYTNELTRNSKEQIKLVCGGQENHYIDNIFIDTHDPEDNYDPIILAGAIKDIAWAYENEIRIRADVAGTRVPDAVYVDIPDYVIKSMEITAGPMFFGNLEYRLKEFQSLCLNLNYSHFHNNLQHMPCYEYMSINEMIDNTSEKPKDPCPEKQALLSGSETVPSADQISLLSFSGMGVFCFHNTGELYIGTDEYRFTIPWHRKGAEIILDHQAGTNPYFTTIPPAHSLSSFTFCSTPSISALNRPVIIVNKNKKVIALNIHSSGFTSDSNVFEMEYEIYTEAKIDFQNADNYYREIEKRRKEFASDSVDQLCGTWGDMNSKRCHMSILRGKGKYYVEIHWASCAWMDSLWTMSGVWDIERQEMNCANEKRVVVESVDQDKVKITTEYENGDSRLFMKDDYLFWEDATKSVGMQCKFIRY